MKLLWFVALASIASAQDCLDSRGIRCLSKAELLSGDLMDWIADDSEASGPCYNNNRFGPNKCVVMKEVTTSPEEKAWLESMGIEVPPDGKKPLYGDCNCDIKNCNCKKDPTCDNSAAVTNTDCSADKTAYGKYGSDHTMVKYCGTSTANCGTVCKRGLDDKAKETILKYHNDVRRKIAKGEEKRGWNVGPEGQPKAANMFELSWDDELAKVAQRWADQCLWEHDKNKKDSRFESVGQNMASTGLSTNEAVDYIELINLWYEQVTVWSPNFETKPGGYKTGHFRQVIWAATKKIGCGMTTFSKGGVRTAHFICNYGPQYYSNGVEEVYEKGETASKCPNGDNDGLCKAA